MSGVNKGWRKQLERRFKYWRSTWVEITVTQNALNDGYHRDLLSHLFDEILW